ncbi:MAG TPA: TonB family protein [Terriglobia bacterium]|nr:TonB family protein [Terriglobia bacterium]
MERKSDEPQLHLLLELEAEAARWRRRTMFLLSILLHAVMIIFALVSPQLFRSGARLLGISLEPKPSPESTFLYLPPDALKRPPPKTHILSDKNRIAQGKAPKIDPNGLKMPYSRGNTPLPEVAGGPPAPAPPAPPAPKQAPGTPPSAGQPKPPEPKKEDAQLRLTDVPAPTGNGGHARLQLPDATPGEAIMRASQDVARGRASGAIGGPGDSEAQFNNPSSNFSIGGAQILSDTLGVDFGPYLARVVMSVRRNWYSVIPISAQMGQKGRVAIVFEIIKDGSVPTIRLVGSSGSEPLDRAALSSINMSNPFPRLPDQFTGNHLVLQFVFLYNLGTGP